MNRFTRGTLALALLLLPLSIFANVAATAEAYKELTVGPAKKAATWSLKSGHAEITFSDARVAPVMAGKEQVGIFVAGGGKFVYESADKSEHAVVRYNGKHASEIKPKESGASLTLSENVSSAVFYGWNLPAVDGGDAPTLASEFASNRELFDRFHGQSQEHALSIAKFDAPQQSRYVRIDMATPNDPLLYEYDDVLGHQESLLALRKRDFIGKKLKASFFSTPLSTQPIGRTRHRSAPARFRLTNVDLQLVASNKDDASLVVTETVTPLARPQRLFRFDLYSEYWTDGDKAPRIYNVRSIKDEKGRELKFSHQMGELLVDTETAVAAGTPLKLTFNIDGNILYRPGGDSYWELGVEPWFPQPGLHEQGYTYHGVVKVQKPFIPFSPGKTIRRETEGEYNVVETQIDKPVQWIALLAGKYNFEEETRNGVTIRVASYATKNARAYKQLAGLAFSIIEHYELYLGPFPFSEFNIIEKNELGYGQAPPATMFITREAFTPMQREANEYVKGINARFAHEIAHQYWGHVVKMPSFEEQWITESFAEYCSALFMKLAQGEGGYRKMLVQWKTEAEESTKVAAIPVANAITNPGDPYSAFRARTGLIYSKGAYLLAMLHKELGDKTFLTFLKSYQASFRWKYGTTDDVADLLEYMTKKDYKPFFERYYWGTELPK